MKMKKEKNEFDNKSLFILFTFIILILILFLISILLINKKQNKDIIKIENEQIIKNNDYVEDALHIKKKGKYTGYCKLGLTHYLDINVNYPKIKLKNPNVTKLNDLILNENKKEIDFILDNNVNVENNKHDTSLYINTNYNYLVQNKLLIISLETNYLFTDNTDYPKIKNYFYDIKNNKILDFKEASKKVNITLEDFKKIDKNNVINSLDDCNQGLCGFKISNNKLVPFIP